MKRTDLTVRPILQDQQKAWDNLVDHPLQSWTWGEFRRLMGIDVVRLGIYKGDNLLEGWQLTFHKIPHSPWTIGYFPKGPTSNETMIDELVRLGRKKNAIFIQLEPNVQKPITYNLQPTTILKPSHHPLFTKYTFILDLTKSEEELLRAMHPKTRYNLKVAQKHGVKIKEDNSTEAFNAYLALSEETTNRQDFFAHDPNYHRRMWKTMSEAGIAKLFTATFENEALLMDTITEP